MNTLYQFIALAGVITLSACTLNTKQANAPAENIESAATGVEKPIETWDLDDLCILPQDGLPAWQALQLWDRIDHGYALADVDNARIEKALNRFKKHPEYIELVIKRGKPYWYYIVSEIEKRGMPLELAYLPIVESGFDPFAYSPGRASGMWQIIPGTARHLGLKNTWWYDGRRDAVASTQAALSYLSSLHKRFDGDWLLAIAAYNSGGGRVNRAIKNNLNKGKPADFWSLDLPRETEAYVPRLLALSKLFRSPNKYGITLPPLSNEAYFSKVNVGGQIDLAQASKLAQISIEDLYYLNPGFNQWATDPNGPHTLLVPRQNAALFEQALKEFPVDQRVTWHRHKIKPGETLSHIAERYKVSTATLTSVNRIKGSKIRAGKTLMVPKASKAASHYTHSTDQRIAKTIQKYEGTSEQKHFHTVRSGESLWSIAKQYNVRSAQLAKWNNMSPKDTLSIGKKLVIWSDTQHLASTNSQGKIIRKLSYKVRKGDSLAKIANKFRVTIRDIAKWNQLNTKKYLQPGQALVLFVSGNG